MSISHTIIEDGKKRRIGNYAHVKNYRKNKKLQIVNLFGGKCCICGYDKCTRNLHFHHVEPKNKSFGVSTAGHGRSLDAVKKEIKKCILVCSNCHGEIHEGLVDAKLYWNH